MLFRAAHDRYLWYQRLHTPLADGHTSRSVAARVAEVYSALVDGRPLADDGPFAPFRRLIDEEAEYQGSAQGKEDRRYWSRRLADLPDPVSLAGAYAPPRTPACGTPSS